MWSIYEPLLRNDLLVCDTGEIRDEKSASLVVFRFSFREASPTGLILRNDRDNMIRGRIVRKFLDNPKGDIRNVSIHFVL